MSESKSPLAELLDRLFYAGPIIDREAAKAAIKDWAKDRFVEVTATHALSELELEYFRSEEDIRSVVDRHLQTLVAKHMANEGLLPIQENNVLPGMKQFVCKAIVLKPQVASIRVPCDSIPTD